MNQFFNVLDSITESTAVINSDGVIIFVNKAWEAFSNQNNGSKTTTDVGVNYLSVCDNVTGEETVMSVNASLGIRQVIDRKQAIFELEYPCHSPNEQRWFILRASTLSIQNELTLVLHIDITKRMLAELEIKNNNERIKVLNQRLNSTMYKIVHDIQSPLNSIIGLIDLTKEENDIDSIKSYLELMNSSSINLKSFIHETLQYISTSPINDYLDFNLLLYKQLESMQPLLNANAIEIKLDVDENIKFYTNAFEFHSVFSNIFTNAIKYCDQKKSKKYIHVFFRTDKNNAVLKIKDNGIGIKNDDLSKLFDQNFQVKEHTIGGVGLGLFMVKKSIDLLEGTISVTSNYAVETEFTIKVPNKLLCV